MTQVTRFTPTIRLDNPRTMTQWQFHIAIFSTLVAGLLCASVSTGYSQKEGKTPVDALPGVLGLVVTVPGFILTSLYNREYVRFEAAKHVYQANAEGKEYTRAIDWEEVEEDDEEVDEYTRDESGWVKDEAESDNRTTLENFLRARGIVVKEIEPLTGFSKERYRLTHDHRISAAQVIGGLRDLDTGLGVKAQVSRQLGFIAVDTPREEREFPAYQTETPPKNEGFWVFVGYEQFTREPIWFDMADPTSCHVVDSGQTGSGKTKKNCAALQSIFDHYTTEQAEIWIIDPKLDQVLIQAAEHPMVTNYITEPMDAVKAFAELVRVMGDRQRNPQNKHLFVLVEECADFTSVNSKLAEHCIGNIDDLLRKGRSAKMHFWLSTQYPKDKVLPREVTSNCPVKICHKVAYATNSRVVLGEEYDGSKLQGKGDGVILIEGKGLIEFQAPFLPEFVVNKNDAEVEVQGHGGVELTEWDSELPELEAELPNESTELLENKDSSFSELPELKSTGWNGDSELPSEYVQIIVDSIRTGQSKTNLLQGVFGAKNGDNKYYKALSQKYEEIKAGLESVSQFN